MVRNLFKGLFILVMGIVLFASCNKEQSVVNDLKALSEEIAEHGENYTQEEWEKATQIHNEIIARKEGCQFTTEQLSEIHQLEAEIAKNAAVAAAKSITNTAKEAADKVGNAVEGIIDGLKAE
ncbi:MAG: hypothetical protein MJZ15_05380 [Bacteroidales bacterium]|nr:hypothetical protein [Bacteroidales bacterium]